MRRAAALAVALLCVLPLHRLLSPERNGPAGADALARAEPVWSLTLWGSLLLALVGVGGALVARRQGKKAPATETTIRVPVAARLRGALLAPSPTTFALGMAVFALALSGTAALLLQRRLLTGVDEMAALIHARYLAAGMLAGPLPGATEAWLLPNTLVTDAGWVSQYPPGHLLVMAALVRVGLEWATGPVLFAATAGLVAACFERVLPAEHRVQARIAALLVAASPFLVILSGASSSHVTAGAAGALALYAALRATGGRAAWALLAGAAVGAMVLARPWTGMVLGPTLTLGVWLERGGPPLALRRAAPWVLGGAPLALLLFWYDNALFGSPFTLGYESLYGPAHGLGLHPDPWSYPYGVREAIAYTASDLVQLGAMLLETPLSIVLVGAVYLVVAPAKRLGTGVVAAWALLPVLAHALYWFHAPRMLSEAAPAWILLAVLGAAYALERTSAALRAGVWSGVAVAALIATAAFVPARVHSQAWTEETLSRITAPAGEADGALVFVHAAWDERLASMLQAAGVRGDSIQPIVRRNDFCLLREYALARLEGAPAASLPAIDLAQSSDPPTGLIALQQPSGSIVWRGESAPWSEACVREMFADRFGSVALAPLLWQGDLPGLERGAPMFVRDFGPQRNEALRALIPNRGALVWAHPPGGRPALLPYDAAMNTFWGPLPSPPPLPAGSGTAPD
jgi:hypothetical protein